jgi:hypothetical protein
VRIRCVVDAHNRWGEGPVWDDRAQALHWHCQLELGALVVEQYPSVSAGQICRLVTAEGPLRSKIDRVHSVAAEIDNACPVQRLRPSETRLELSRSSGYGFRNI